MIRFTRIAVAAALMLVYVSGFAQDTARIMYYNVLNFPGSTPERADTLKIILDHAQPNILVVNELISEEGADLILNKVLPKSLKRAAFVDGRDTDNMLFYDSDIFTLYETDVVETALRDINRYVLYSNKILRDDTMFMSFFSAHLKASSGSENETKRLAECQAFLDYLDTQPYTPYVFFGGDFNFYDADEDAYKLLLTVFEDPIDAFGDWHDNAAYASIHTQSTRTTRFGGGANGGMDDRFDFILVTSEILGENNVHYVPDSYMALGQDGNRLNGSMIAPRQNTKTPANVNYALRSMSDHLPVMMNAVIENEIHESLHDVVREQEYSISNGALSIQLSTANTCTITDLQGRLIFQADLKDGAHTIPLPGATQIFVVHLANKSSTFRFKVLRP